MDQTNVKKEKRKTDDIDLQDLPDDADGDRDGPGCTVPGGEGEIATSSGHDY